MKILIQNGRVIDPASGLDQIGDVAVAAGRIVGLNRTPADFAPTRTIDASGCIVLPGLVDLAARLREPGHEHEGMLESEMAAAVAGGVTSLVCPPDTDPVLDEPGLVEMLKFRAEKLHQSRLFPLGALTRSLAGEVLTEMAELTESGCVGFGQAEVPLASTQVLQRALQYAATFGYTVWLRPQEMHLGKGVAASGPLATRLGLSGVPVAAETIALHTIFELLKTTGARVLGTALGTLQASVGQLVEGGVADLCVFDPQAAWTVQADALRSQGKHTPFSGYELPGSVRATVVGGQVAFEREPG